MDRHLLAREQLLVRLSEIRARKIAERDEGMASRNTQINTIDGYIVGIGADLSKKDNVARMIDLKRRLQMQVGILKKKYGYSTVGLTPLPLFGSYCRLKVPVYGDFILDQALHIRMSALWTTHKENRVRWFDFLGHRIIKEVRVVIDDTVLEHYGYKREFSIIRVHKRIERIMIKAFDNVNISEIKHAVESMSIRFHPNANQVDDNRAETWRLNDVSPYNEIKYASIVSTGGTTSPAYTPAYYNSMTPGEDAPSALLVEEVLEPANEDMDRNDGLSLCWIHAPDLEHARRRFKKYRGKPLNS
ncbi:hypothetical protein PF004_g19802 [Phytophthora fragariae]|uniref:Uncharacterized protein n=1 Tax=Phytophthora fragariae TaxID=53985 RepID=A0A6G0R307_9STRA|nr:hypothetical protein PF004_g19802 [Phytophthora fragariae]KAE9313713.1 hypothetical protein PF008_g19662 [Phytophthora fragariae]